MTKIVVSMLILFSSAASIYYSINGVISPESALVYNKAHMSRAGIQLMSLLLGVGGVLILLPQTFKFGGGLLFAHSLITIGCFFATRDWKGGLLEFEPAPSWWTSRKGLLSTEFRQCSRENHIQIHSRKTLSAA
jgi:hypothetical protein